MSTGNKNHAAVALLQELQRTNAGKKFNITTANPLLAGTYDYVICTHKLKKQFLIKKNSKFKFETYDVPASEYNMCIIFIKKCIQLLYNLLISNLDYLLFIFV